MADEVNNCHLINAPAGSGKTTLIKSMVRKFYWRILKTIFYVLHIQIGRQMN